VQQQRRNTTLQPPTVLSHSLLAAAIGGTAMWLSLSTQPTGLLEVERSGLLNLPLLALQAAEWPCAASALGNIDHRIFSFALVILGGAWMTCIVSLAARIAARSGKGWSRVVSSSVHQCERGAVANAVPRTPQRRWRKTLRAHGSGVTDGASSTHRQFRSGATAQLTASTSRLSANSTASTPREGCSSPRLPTVHR
jgi:hypothetical protein